MSEKCSHAVWAIVLCTMAVVLELGGGRLLWRFILTMHGMHLIGCLKKAGPLLHAPTSPQSKVVSGRTKIGGSPVNSPQINEAHRLNEPSFAPADHFAAPVKIKCRDIVDGLDTKTACY